jgi:hypothetical protein
MERKRPIYYERKKEIATHQRTHLSQRKEVRVAFAFAFAFAFALHLSFSMVKGIKLKEKLKRKKKGVRIQAIIGRIRTRDPDPGHFGPNFDGLGSPFTDPGPGARLKAGTFWTFYGLFWTRLVPEKICSDVCLKGGTAFRQNLTVGYHLFSIFYSFTYS